MDDRPAFFPGWVADQQRQDQRARIQTLEAALQDSLNLIRKGIFPGRGKLRDKEVARLQEMLK